MCLLKPGISRTSDVYCTTQQHALTLLLQKCKENLEQDHALNRKTRHTCFRCGRRYPSPHGSRNTGTSIEHSSCLDRTCTWGTTGAFRCRSSDPQLRTCGVDDHHNLRDIHDFPPLLGKAAVAPCILCPQRKIWRASTGDAVGVRLVG